MSRCLEPVLFIDTRASIRVTESTDRNAIGKILSFGEMPGDLRVSRVIAPGTDADGNLVFQRGRYGHDLWFAEGPPVRLSQAGP